MQGGRTNRKTGEIQVYADRIKARNSFTAIKAIFGPQTKGIAPLLSSGRSTLLTEKSQIMKRWDERFRSIPNPLFTISDAAIYRLTQVETNTDLDLPSSPSRNHPCCATTSQRESTRFRCDTS
ncbi:hypothetical protein SprV_0100026900 [Sparganum proliferum]